MHVVNIKKFKDAVATLQTTFAMTLKHNRKSTRDGAERGQLANFMGGDFVLVARETFHKGDKLCIRWRGPAALSTT